MKLIDNFHRLQPILRSLLSISGERPYQCDLCSRAFTTRGNLRTHYSTVHRRELPPASASHSINSAKKQAAMQQQTTTKSDSPTSINCPLCNSSFTDQYSFTQHMQQHAAIDKPFISSELNKSRSESAGRY